VGAQGEWGGRPWLVALWGQLRQAWSSCHGFSNIVIISREFVRFDRRVSPPHWFPVIHNMVETKKRQKIDKTYNNHLIHLHVGLIITIANFKN